MALVVTNKGVLDTLDLTVERVSQKQLNTLCRHRVPLIKRVSSIFGVYFENNAYQIYVLDREEPIFSGYFPNNAYGLVLYEYDCRITEFKLKGSKVLLGLTCTCFALFNTEVQLSMMHFIEFNLTNLTQGTLFKAFNTPHSVVKDFVLRKELKTNSYPNNLFILETDWERLKQKTVNIWFKNR